MPNDTDFESAFHALTGHKPFPWQEDLFGRFLAGKQVAACDIPTGLGKTGVIPIWLIALAHQAGENGQPSLARRLVYVVNRRTVVDQSTDVVERIRQRLVDPYHADWEEHGTVLAGLSNRLRSLSSGTDDVPLAVSTLRGQLADNGQWRLDPTRPAVILGTVDMIGSRLLFNGYRAGFRSRPLYAGLLGQDVLLVHDEAHLEPAFQRLLDTIEEEQGRETQPLDETAKDLSWPRLRVMAFSATRRVDGNEDEAELAFSLTDEELNVPSDLADEPTEPIHHVWRRLTATKSLHLIENKDPKKLAEEITDLALEYRESGQPILVFTQTVKDVDRITQTLDKKKQQYLALTGTMRGLERDGLVSNPVFQRFLPKSSRNQAIKPADGTAFLVCTSAGEVGVDISADHLVCDLTTFESMAQRFGRVNRFGDCDGSCIHVVHPVFEDLKDHKQYDACRMQTLDLLKGLGGDASPAALGNLDARARSKAFAPTPTVLPATDILFDAWSLTTITEKLPGRPPVEPYLHGIRDYEQPETHVAWREEVELITKKEGLLERYPPDELLDDYPLKPHELLRDRSDRVFDELKKMVTEPKRTKRLSADEFRELAARARKKADLPVWIVRPRESVRVESVTDLLRVGKEAIFGCTLLLPPCIGGLKDGMLDGTSADANDVSSQWLERSEEGDLPQRVRVWNDDEQPRGMRLIRPRIDTCPDAEEDDEEPRQRYWSWYYRPHAAEFANQTAESPVPWDAHVNDVESRLAKIVEALSLPGSIRRALVLAARFHDLGKRRTLWQLSIGNPDPKTPYAKPGKHWHLRDTCPHYRHEFGSLLDVLDLAGPHWATLAELDAEVQDLVLHLIAAHHGRGRPHFASCFDPEPKGLVVSEVAAEVPRRFARLQRRYGRWGLAYLESLLRAADWAASADPSSNGEDA